MGQQLGACENGWEMCYNRRVVVLVGMAALGALTAIFMALHALVGFRYQLRISRPDPDRRWQNSAKAGRAGEASGHAIRT